MRNLQNVAVLASVAVGTYVSLIFMEHGDNNGLKNTISNNRISNSSHFGTGLRQLVARDNGYSNAYVLLFDYGDDHAKAGATEFAHSGK